MIVDCKIIMTNLKVRELTGQDSIILMPFSFDISMVTAYRQSVDDDSIPEEYSVIYTEYGDTYCIDISYGEFNYIYKKYINDNSNKEK
jgi:hypothetical protein